jgi:type IV pilus assembly protein PilF
MKGTILKTVNSLIAISFLLLAGCTVSGVRLNQRAQVYMDHGQYDRAEKLLRKALDADHENPASHYWLGKTYEAMGNTEKAIYQYDLAIRFAPAMDAAQLALVEIYHKDRQEEQSLQTTNRYLRHKNDTADNIIIIARHFSDQGMDGQAVLAFKQAQEKEPYSEIPSLELAKYYRAKGQPDLEANALMRAAEINPTNADTARLLGTHGIRVSVPRPLTVPRPPTAVERDLRDLEL